MLMMLMMPHHQFHWRAYSPFVGLPASLDLSFGPNSFWPSPLGQANPCSGCFLEGADGVFSGWNSSATGASYQKITSVAKWTPNCADDAPLTARVCAGIPTLLAQLGVRFATLQAVLITSTRRDF